MLPLPLVKPDMQISRIRLSRRLSLEACTGSLGSRLAFSHSFHLNEEIVFPVVGFLQAALPLSYENLSSTGFLRSTVVTRFTATMNPSDSRHDRSAVMYSRISLIVRANDDSPLRHAGPPRFLSILSARAVPNHPGSPDGRICSLLHHRRRASPLSGGLAVLHFA